MIITGFNPTVDDLETTYLSQSYNLGVTSIEVKNNQQFSNNTRIQIGAPGLASTEIVTCSTPNADGSTLPISATLFAHEADAPVYLLQFDQVQFYRSTTGIDGAYSLLSTQNLDVTNGNLQTLYNDLTANIGDYYELAMYNSLTTVTSAFSNPIPGITGWARNQCGYIIGQILTEINDQNEQNITRAEILGYFNEVNDDLLQQVVKPYNFLLKREVFPRVAGSNFIDWPVDSFGNNAMWKFDHMDYNYVNSATNPVTDVTYTVEEAPSLEYFRNRFNQNLSYTAAPSSLTLGLGAGGTLSTASTYFYVVTATYPESPESGPSPEESATPITGDQTIVLSWPAVPGATGYNVYRGLASGGELLLVSVTGTTYNDNNTATVGSQVPPSTNQDDYVRMIALNEAEQQFDYYPASLTSSTSVWYLYYYSFFTQLSSEGDTIQTPTPRIYKLYAKAMYYLKRSVSEPAYLQQSTTHMNNYTIEKARYKGQDRRSVGKARRFVGQSRTNKSFNY